MVMDLIVILWITVWLMYWSWENKRHLQDVRDLRVRVFELEHKLCHVEQRIEVVQDGVFSVIKIINEGDK